MMHAIDTTTTCQGPAERHVSMPSQLWLVCDDGQQVALPGRRGHITIGSHPSNDLVLSRSMAASVHCFVEWEGTTMTLVDRGSEDGTWIHRSQVQRCRLFPGSTFRVGARTFEVARGGDRRCVAMAALIGESEAMARLRAVIRSVARTSYPVLVQGETGTGKELVARAIHQLSARSSRPLEVVNCGSIPDSLAESELFGHCRGAFTGATHGYRGAFARADGGTLFLDEIGELPLLLQPKLLRVLEQKTLRPVGDERERKVDVRFISATHRNIAAEAERGAYRHDLFHRLSVAVVDVPPLDARRDDIPLLVDHVLREISWDLGRQIDVSPAALTLLQTHRWPGNVRALRNAVQRASLGGALTLAPSDFDFLAQTPAPRLDESCSR